MKGDKSNAEYNTSYFYNAENSLVWKDMHMKNNDEQYRTIGNQRKARILYYTLVDWNWIIQRPQLLAEELSKRFELIVLYPFANRRKNHQKHRKIKVKTIPLFSFPYESKSHLLASFNSLSRKYFIKLLILLWKPDILWLSYPEQILSIPKKTKVPYFYDCMDDYISMARNFKHSEKLAKCEQELISKAKWIAVSSMYLKTKLESRYQLSPDSVSIVRNGFKDILLNNELKVSDNLHNGKFRIGYIGTVSHWFDWNIVLQSLSDFPNIEYHIIGPITPGIVVPKNNRIISHGTIEHHLLYENIADCQCLCMPFLLNDTVEAVDPVKLYEYINFNKPIISIRYHEVLAFEKFAHLYSTYDEYREQLNFIIAARGKPKYTLEDRGEFLSLNTWKNRTDTIESLISKNLNA